MRVFLLALIIIGAALCCVENGRTFQDGEEWISGQFVKKCVQRTHTLQVGWAVKIVGCNLPCGGSIRIGETRNVGNTAYYCEKYGDRQARLLSRSFVFTTVGKQNQYQPIAVAPAQPQGVYGDN